MYIYTRVCPCVKCNLCVYVYVCVALSKMGFLSALEEKGLALSPLLLPSQLWAGLKVPINLDGDGCHSSVLTLPLVSLFPVSHVWLLPFLGQRTSGRGFWLGVADPQRTSVLVQSPGHVGGTPWGLGRPLPNKSLDGQGLTWGRDYQFKYEMQAIWMEPQDGSLRAHSLPRGGLITTNLADNMQRGPEKWFPRKLRSV